MAPPPVVYPGVYVEEVPSRPPTIEGVATAVTAFLGATRRGPLQRPIALSSFHDFELIFGQLWEASPLGFAVRDFFLNGGERAIIVRLKRAGARRGRDSAALQSDDYLGREGVATGLHALAQAEFNLLCLPPPTFQRDLAAEVWSGAADYCERRRAFLLIDAPATWRNAAEARGDGVSTGIAALGTRSKNAAVYFPRLRLTNPLPASELDFAACGAIAGVFARTDGRRGVWKAPAGLEAMLQGVAQVSPNLTDAESGLLHPLGINCLRAVAGRCVVWGARTLQGDDRFASEWKYIPVRRLALFIEESVDRGTKWAVLAANDEALWARVRGSVELFLDSLFRAGAFQGTTSRQAYFVKCGNDTTTADDLAAGAFVIEIGFAPLRPAEFVSVRVRQRAGE